MNKTRFFFQISTLFIGFLGSVFAFLNGFRTSSMFTIDGVILGRGHESWFHQNLGNIGFTLLALSFSLQIVIAFLDHFNRWDNKINSNRA